MDPNLSRTREQLFCELAVPYNHNLPARIIAEVLNKPLFTAEGVSGAGTGKAIRGARRSAGFAAEAAGEGHQGEVVIVVLLCLGDPIGGRSCLSVIKRNERDFLDNHRETRKLEQNFQGGT